LANKIDFKKNLKAERDTIEDQGDMSLSMLYWVFLWQLT